MCDDPLLTAHQLAEWLGVPVSWVYDQVQLKRIPNHKLSYRMLRFDRAEIRAWLAEQEREAVERLPAPRKRRAHAR